MSSGCRSGMRVVACTVDIERRGYQCYSEKAGNQFYQLGSPFSEDLECADPLDVEAFLKACIKNEVIVIPLCTYRVTDEFVCRDPDGQQRVISLQSGDRMSCLLKKDRKRLIQRCLKL